MSEAEFIFEGKHYTILCQETDKMKNVFEKFYSKTHLKEGSLYFLYGGNIISEDLTFEQALKNEDKQKKKMFILANLINEELIEKSKIIQSKEVICPECGKLQEFV